jgi:hypothetical protein
VREVDRHAVGVVGHERAARAALLPAGAEHEVLDEELAPAGEQRGERARAVRGVEDVVLLDPLPRQGAALAGDLVAEAERVPSRAPSAPCGGRASPRARRRGAAARGVPAGETGASATAVFMVRVPRENQKLVARNAADFGRRTARTLPLPPPPA